jgi:hypothetical protein
VVHHGESLQVPPSRSGRQLDVRTPSWVESLTPSKVTEAKVLLAEICLLKDRGLTTEVVLTDFVFKNIQSLKDRAYPAYLYSGINDSTRVTNKRIPTEDLVSRLGMIMRGRVSMLVLMLPILPRIYHLIGHFLNLCPTLLLVMVVWVLECDPLLRTLRL